MKEISLHILDIAQNSIHAEASRISVEIKEDRINNVLTVAITDNGTGMSEDQIRKTLNPFYTTKRKKTGLGIPLFKQHAEMAGGDLNIHSELNKGTKLIATFEYNNIDRQPIGEITKTLTGLIRSYPQVHFIYSHSVDKKQFVFDTEEIKAELDGIPIHSAEIISFIQQMIDENIREIGVLQNPYSTI